MNEDNDDLVEGLFSFPESELDRVLEKMKEDCGGLIETCELDELKSFWLKFAKINKIVDENNSYFLSEDIIHNFNDYIISETLVELQKKGLIETCWDEKENDFVFKAKDIQDETPKD